MKAVFVNTVARICNIDKQLTIQNWDKNVAFLFRMCYIIIIWEIMYLQRGLTDEEKREEG